MTVTSVNIKKQGTGKKGPWTMYAVELDNGTTASGFDAVQIGDTVTVEKKGQYLNYSKVGNGTRQFAPTSSYQRSTPKDPRGNGNDDRSNRIERQHSQEMAIRYCVLRGQKEISTAGLRELIDWFQRDVGHVPSAPASQHADGPPDIPDEEPF